MGIWDIYNTAKKAKDIWDDPSGFVQNQKQQAVATAIPWGIGAVQDYRAGDITPGFNLGISQKLSGSQSSGGPKAVPTSNQYDGLIGPQQQFAYTPWDPSVAGLSTGGGGYYGGGGGGAAVAAQKLVDDMRAKQQEYGDREKGLITGRRDAFIGDTEKGYQDQLNWLQSQTDSARAGAEAGKTNINTQKDQSIASTEKTAEGEARGLRDVYQDLIVENRRRTRATGAGSSSAFLELTNKLDTQLQGGLAQVGDTKVEKVGVANTIAQQAVGELERTLQNVIAQIDQNKATSMREKDKAITDARLNADEALLGVDRWLTETFSSLDQAKLSLQTGGGGGGSSVGYNKANYGQQMSSTQNSLLNNIGLNLANMQKAGMTSQADKLNFLQSRIPDLQMAGMNLLDTSRYFGLMAPEGNAINNDTQLYLENPEAWAEKKRLEQQYGGFNYGNTNTGGNINLP